LTVAGVVEAVPTMLFVTRTVQTRFEPPALTFPLHCVTLRTSAVDGVVVVTHVSGRVLADPSHAFVTVTELVSPVAMFRLLVTVTSHATA
jgi:hypothetical protein